MGRPSKGRQRIEIRFIEDADRREVTFSKRKFGLLKKVSELSLLCGAHVAFVVFSPGGRAFALGTPSVDHVLRLCAPLPAGEPPGCASPRPEADLAAPVAPRQGPAGRARRALLVSLPASLHAPPAALPADELAREEGAFATELAGEDGVGQIWPDRARGGALAPPPSRRAPASSPGKKTRALAARRHRAYLLPRRVVVVVRPWGGGQEQHARLLDSPGSGRPQHHRRGRREVDEGVLGPVIFFELC